MFLMFTLGMAKKEYLIATEGGGAVTLGILSSNVYYSFVLISDEPMNWFKG